MFDQQRWLKAGFLIPLFAFCGMWLSACQPAPEAYRFSGSVMGTTYNITVVDVPSSLELGDIQQGVHAALAYVDSEMSTYKPDSGLMKLNTNTVGEAQEISAALMEVLLMSQQIYQASKGAFDPTVGALVNAWGFGPRDVSVDELPSDAQLDDLLQSIGFDNVELDVAQSMVVRRSEVFIDLSAIAKGYGVDRAADWLLAQGINNFLVEVGGELRTHGYSPRGAGSSWVTAITEPDSGIQPSIHRRLQLDNMAVATSGDYYNFFTVEGERFSHTIDPRTGRPVTHHLASVTVVSTSCAEADAYATAIDVMGPEQGLAMAEKLGLAVYILSRSDNGFVASQSSAFGSLMANNIR
jgi:thiamine biosynthesis lipoprotein